MRVLGFTGGSGAGKTTLLEKLIPELRNRNQRVAVIKHAHHGFDMDTPGKDSWRHRQAGAAEVLVSGGQRWALLHECGDQPEPGFQDHLKRLSPCDWVLIEGYKREDCPRIEVWRSNLQRPFVHSSDDRVIAVAADCALPDCLLPVLPLNDPVAIVDFIMERLPDVELG